MWKWLQRRAWLLSMTSTLAFILSNAPAELLRPKLPAKLVPEKKVQQVPLTVKRLPTSDDAVRLALEDAGTLPIEDLLFTRWLFIQDASVESMKVASLALNVISRSSVIYRPIPVMGGLLLRLNFRQQRWAPTEADLNEWLVLWEELGFDPAFARLVTKDQLRFSGINAKDLPKRKVAKTVIRHVVVSPEREREERRWLDHPGGRFTFPDDSGRVLDDLKPGRYDARLLFKVPAVERDVVETVEEEVADVDFDVLRFDPEHVDQRNFQALKLLTGSRAPVVEHRYFLTRVLATIKGQLNAKETDSKVFKAVFGGLYYEFRGVRKAKDVLGKDTKATDLDLFFQQLGIGSINGKESQEQLFDRLRSDQRVAVFRSGVTGKPRDVVMFQTPAAKETSGWGAITGDIRDDQIDIGDRSVANLLKPRRAAREALFPGANGFQIAALFNGDGVLQDEVPHEVADDSTIPHPHTQRLQPAIGCIRCHGTDGSDGWKPLRNDVKTLMKRGKLDIFGDLTGRRFNDDTIDRLVGLYQGDFTKNLTRARDDVAEVTLRATGPWKQGREDQSEVAKVASQRLADEWAEYNFDLVTPHVALKELGFDVPAAHSVAVLRRLLLPDLDQADVNQAGQLFFQEDVRVGALLEGLGINRADFALSYHGAAVRAKRTMQAHKGDVKWLEN